MSVAFAARGSTSRVVEQAGFSIQADEAVGLLGESGCGKSTLASALLRLLPAERAQVSGSVLWQGRDLMRLPERELRQVRGGEISLIHQEPALALNPVLRAGTQIAEVLRSHGRPAGKDAVCDLLRETGFDDPQSVVHAYPHQLSGGQRQRVGIAQALSCRPRLVIADEPTSKLDASLQCELLELFAGLRRKLGIAFLLITHDPAVLAAMCSRALIMYAGRIVEQCSVARLLSAAAHPYSAALARLARQNAGAAGARQRFPEIANPGMLGAGCRFEPRCLDRMAVCATCAPPQTPLADDSLVS